jgi:hypothetical protein
MAFFAPLFIFIYLGIRFVLQVWIPRGSIKIKKSRVALGVIWLPLESIIYFTEIINYMIIWTPGSLALPPMSVWIFLIWLAFVVADTLYQFHVVSRIPEPNT